MGCDDVTMMADEFQGPDFPDCNVAKARWP